MRTFVDVLRRRGAEQPDREACTFLLDDGDGTETVTYGELDERARRIAVALDGHARPGDRALLLYPPGLDYVSAFFGCLYAGVAAVPAYPPLGPRQAPRLAALAGDARPAAVLTTGSLVDPGRGLLDGALTARPPRWLATDEVTDGAADWRPAPVHGEDIAFLQYTSGSTGHPKGVLVSHDNLMHNSAFINDRFGNTADSRGVIWLPPYHDMGLIGGILQPVHGGFPVTLFSPMRFLRDPVGWLRAVSEWKATASGGPNFAYDLCLRKLEPGTAETLDLTSWRVAFTGAEPVRPATLARFSAALAPAGLRPEAFYPCYGLAEATLMVTGVRRAERPIVGRFAAGPLSAGRVAGPSGAEPAREFVSCGRPADDQQVLIVDPANARTVGADRVGEIWVRGPSVAAGYWADPVLTGERFGASLADGPAGFVRTGDLGFLRDGELYVVGRSKDMIIVRGRNHAAEDVELAAGADPRLRPGGGAAFGVDVDDAEAVAVVHEVRAEVPDTELDDVAEAIRHAVARELGLAVHTVALLRPGDLPKTSSGKVRRAECRRALLAGELPTLAVSRLSATDAAPGGVSDVRAAVRTTAAGLLGASERALDDDQPLTALGLDSVKAVELVAAVERETGVRLPLADVLGGARLAELTGPVGPSGREPEPEGAPDALTEGERAMWFLHRLAPDASAYHLGHAADVDPGIDPRRFRTAVDRLTERHPALRTNFRIVDGEPRRDVHGPPPDVATVDAAGWDDAAIDADIARLTADPFDLAEGPLWRIRQYRRAGPADVVAVGVHHIVADLWSLTVVVRDMLALCADPDAFADAAPLADMSEVARRERAYLAGADGRRDIETWRHRLADPPGRLDLPADRIRPPAQTFGGAVVELTHEASVTTALRLLARSVGTTPYTVLLTSFAWLLHRYSGAGEVVVGAPAPVRLDPSVRDTVGLLVNAVPMRVPVDGDEPFTDAIRRVGMLSRQALAGQRVPFPRLVDLVGPAREPSHNPLFQVMLVLQTAPGDDPLAAFPAGDGRLSAHGFTLTPRPVGTPGAQVDLSVEVAAASDGTLRCRLLYNTDLFGADTVRRLARHWQVLLEQAMSHPERSLAGSVLLDEAEERRLVHDWNGPAEPFVPTLIHDGMLTAAARTPHARALADERTTLDYAALEARTATLAATLAGHDVGPESRVGILLERGADFVVAALAALRAGGAYVPLDPSHPTQRLATIAADAGLEVLVTDTGHASLAAAITGAPLLDIAAAGVARGPGDLPVARPDNLAYLMYTSGSTGRPKGVSCTHVGVANLHQAINRMAPLSGDDVCAWWTSGGFDVSVYEIFSALDAGAALLVVPEAVRPHPARLADWLAEHRVTSCFLPPFALTELAERAESEVGPELRLRRLLVGLEPLPEPLLRRILRAVPGLTMINGYGPTETTIFSTLHVVDPAGRHDGIAPLGRPVPNGPIYLLDPAGRPVPQGVPAEVCIGGVAVARGYHGDPARTAEAFRPDPYAGEPGSRLYRTGDIARHRPDTLVQFLGRRDHQVKVRGVRVELGEIEAVLAGHPAVRSALVVARSINGVTALIAYVVTAEPADDGTILVTALTAHLRRALTAPMLPAVIVPLAAWPVTVNGKLDRAALPEPAEHAGAAYEAPDGELENAVAGVWSTLFGGRRVGRHDDFFGLGGHSLLAARAAVQLGAQLDVEVPVALTFSHPTVAEFATELGELLAADNTDPPIVALPRAGIDPADLLARLEELPPDVVAALAAQYGADRHEVHR